LIVAPGATATVANAEFEGNEIGLLIEGKVLVTKSVVQASRQFGAHVGGQATFTDLTFQRNPVALTAVAPGVAEVSETQFAGNATHIEASGGGKVIGNKDTFTESTGGCGVHVRGAIAQFTPASSSRTPKWQFSVRENSHSLSPGLRVRAMPDSYSAVDQRGWFPRDYHKEWKGRRAGPGWCTDDQGKQCFGV
jgi:hypothetical protein